MSVPPGLAWWRGEPGGAGWLDRLPELVAECAEQWALALEAPYHALAWDPDEEMIACARWLAEAA
ncbi:MAG: hypothetical protein ACRDNI_14115 [Gaiellaceae bacterium]